MGIYNSQTSHECKNIRVEENTCSLSEEIITTEKNLSCECKIHFCIITVYNILSKVALTHDGIFLEKVVGKRKFDFIFFYINILTSLLIL